jgi:curved DNA binding protein
LSHQLKQYIIDGSKTILQRPDVDQQVDDITFEVNEVYAIDIVMSTGEGKVSQRDARTTIFKRQLDQSYQLKSKHARAVFSQVAKKYQSMPFTLRSLGMENEAKFGIVEMVNHDLVVGYPVLYEKDGEYVAQIKFTALVLPNSTTRLPNALPPPFVSSDFSIDSVPEIQKVMAMSTKRNKKKAKKKAAAGGSVADADEMDTE